MDAIYLPIVPQVQNTEGPTKDNPLQTEGEDEQDTGGTKISLLGK